MGLRDRLRRLLAPPSEPADERGRPYRGRGDTTIAEAPLRTATALAGEVAEVRVVARAGTSSLEIEVDDGTGVAVGVFTGRQSIPGITPGRGVVLEGVARRERGRLVLLNPGYRLL